MAWKCYMVILEPSGFFRDAGTLCSYRSLPPGAMWWDHGELVVKLPGGGEWNIDRGRLINARAERTGPPLPAWTRTGDPPAVTATPSINHQGVYHGWLRDGELSDDLDGRQYT